VCQSALRRPPPSAEAHDRRAGATRSFLVQWARVDPISCSYEPGPLAPAPEDTSAARSAKTSASRDGFEHRAIHSSDLSPVPVQPASADPSKFSMIRASSSGQLFVSFEPPLPRAKSRRWPGMPLRS
jgi:hypothetical protein